MNNYKTKSIKCMKE